jgi:N-acetyl sugar amidotransferase
MLDKANSLSQQETSFCERCLYSTSHPLGLVLDEEGICSGCRVHEEKDSLDWIARFELLRKITESYRSKTGKNYDCVVPVSGAGDSYFIVDVVKNRLGLNPLLVSYNKYWNTEAGIWNLANLRTSFNCDILIQNVNPQSVNKIVSSTLSEFGSIYWHCIAGQTVFPVQVAVTHRIPLIIWGAHQGVEQVGMFSHKHEVEMTRRYRKDHDLMGKEADDLITIFNSLTEEDVWQYRYPSDVDLHDIGVRGIYLSNYVRWDPISQHEKMIKGYNFKTHRFERTFDCYDFVDCHNYMGIHDNLKLYKHGFSKITDHCCREIRHGRISRTDAITKICYYEQQAVKGMQLFSEWLGMDQLSLEWMMNTYRNQNFWKEVGFRKWKFKGLSTHFSMQNVEHKSNVSLEPLQNYFTSNRKLEEYIIFGKGFP